MGSARLRVEAGHLCRVHVSKLPLFGGLLALGQGSLNDPGGQHALLLVALPLQRDLVQNSARRGAFLAWRPQHFLLRVSVLDPVCHWPKRPFHHLLVGVSNNEGDLLHEKVPYLLKRQRTPDFVPHSGYGGEKSRGVFWIVKHEVGIHCTHIDVVGAERGKNIPTRAACLVAATLRHCWRLVEVSLAQPATNATACGAFFGTSLDSLEEASQKWILRLHLPPRNEAQSCLCGENHRGCGHGWRVGIEVLQGREMKLVHGGDEQIGHQETLRVVIFGTHALRGVPNLHARQRSSQNPRIWRGLGQGRSADPPKKWQPEPKAETSKLDISLCQLRTVFCFIQNKPLHVPITSKPEQLVCPHFELLRSMAALAASCVAQHGLPACELLCCALGHRAVSCNGRNECDTFLSMFS